jgi:hypothetical protein
LGNHVGITSCEPAVLLYNAFGELINDVCRPSCDVLLFLVNVLLAPSDIEINGKQENAQATKSSINSITIPPAMLILRVNRMNYPCSAAGRSMPFVFS